jgi:anti-sigma factor RsiW
MRKEQGHDDVERPGPETMNTTPHLGDDILNAWIDDVATPQEREAVDDHVATCEVCRQRLDELQAVQAIFASLPDVTPPRSFQLTPAQANAPTPIRPAQQPSTLIRLLPIVRSLSVAAIFAVMILGGVLAFGPNNDTMTSNETGNVSRSLEVQNPAAQETLEPGEVSDQGVAASAHDSTNNSLADEAQDAGPSSSSSDDGLTGLEITTIAVGALAAILGVTWLWISMSIRTGGSH